MPRPFRTSTWQIRLQAWPLLLLTSIAIVGAQAQSAPNQSAGTAPTTQPSTSKSADKKATQNTRESSGQAPDVLVQLNGALEGLAAKVSSSVVQILVTGYGPAPAPHPPT